MIRIGILGGIGSGKSYIAKNFGYPVFNADREVEKLYQTNKKIFNKLNKKLPKYINSFPIDKKEILNAILTNKKNLSKIVKIVHAEVQKKMNVSEITLSNRTREKAENLKSIFNNLNIIKWGEVSNFDMIINATSLGLNKNDEINLNYSSIHKNKLFYDVIYNPKETEFLRNGKNLGNITINGKLMFVYQAFLAFNIWHEQKPDINEEVLKLLD